MNFCVLIKIKKNLVSFWYQIKGSNYAPLKIKESNEVPLYFYVNGNDFIFGNLARNRFYCNDPFAYGNYFNIITDPSKHFTIYGNQKPIKQLLYIGIEQYLDFFIKNVLYKSESIESYRQNFPIRFLFDSDIEDKERFLVESLFSEAGYDNIKTESYYSALLNSLVSEGIINENFAVLLLTGIDNVLYLELFKKQFLSPDAFSKIVGQGSDPRVRVLSEIILEDILARNSYLQVSRDKEVAAIVPFSASFLQDPLPIITGDVALSDGTSYYFKIKLRELNDRMLFYSGDNKIFNSIEDLFSKNGVNNTSAVLLLNGSEINTTYFLEKLLKKYPNVEGVPQAIESDALKTIFKKIEDENYFSKRAYPGVPGLPPIVTSTEGTQVPPRPPVIIPKNGDKISSDGPVAPNLPPMKKSEPKKIIAPPPPPPAPIKKVEQKKIVLPPPPPPPTTVKKVEPKKTIPPPPPHKK